MEFGVGSRWDLADPGPITDDASCLGPGHPCLDIAVPDLDPVELILNWTHLPYSGAGSVHWCQREGNCCGLLEERLIGLKRHRDALGLLSESLTAGRERGGVVGWRTHGPVGLPTNQPSPASGCCQWCLGR